MADKIKNIKGSLILLLAAFIWGTPIWAMFFVLPILSATYGTFNYLQNLEILTDGWYKIGRASCRERV